MTASRAAVTALLLFVLTGLPAQAADASKRNLQTAHIKQFI